MPMIHAPKQLPGSLRGCGLVKTGLYLCWDATPSLIKMLHCEIKEIPPRGAGFPSLGVHSTGSEWWDMIGTTYYPFPSDFIEEAIFAGLGISRAISPKVALSMYRDQTYHITHPNVPRVEDELPLWCVHAEYERERPTCGEFWANVHGTRIFCGYQYQGLGKGLNYPTEPGIVFSLPLARAYWKVYGEVKGLDQLQEKTRMLVRQM